MGQDPDVIRREIEDTRERMGETVDALSYKADVKTRAKESVSEKVDTIKSKVTGATDRVSDAMTGAGDRVSDATPSGGDVKRVAKRSKGIAQENPLGLAVGSLAVGFLAGMMLPSTRIEDEKMGEVSDQMIDKAKEAGQEALDRGKQVASEAASAAKETAQEQGQQHASEMQESVSSSQR